VGTREDEAFEPHGSTASQYRAPVRVVLCSAFGSLDDLTVVEVDPTPCGPEDVRVEITAAGVNFVDALFVQGLYQIKPPLPFVPGSEVAGRVAEIGAAVTSHRVGDRVFVNAGLGGYASEMVLPARRARSSPDALTDGQAATFTQSYMTAWFALRHRAAARPGQWLLVLGAGGGVGLAAVDVGRALGLRVIAAASSSDKRRLASDRGAEAVVDSSTEDVKARAREIADGDGVDLVYDPVGGVQGEQALRALRDDGQNLIIGFASGTIPKLPANQILLRNRRVTGVDWGGWAAKNPAANEALLDEVIASVGRGDLHPVEPAAYRLDDASAALRDQQERRVTGKAILVP
jgi:NADPH2:quinone reductase